MKEILTQEYEFKTKNLEETHEKQKEMLLT
jgi:hypothetical protein